MMEKASVLPRVFRRSILLMIVILLIVFSFGILNVAAANQVLLDWETDAAGNPLLSGQVIDDEFHSAQGISITISGVSNRAGGADVRAIFPSDSPPIDGNGDPIDSDLGSPNETCPGGGPGIGTGGELGTPGENCVALGNVLILPTIDDADQSGFIDGQPNDDAAGGLGIFEFSAPVTIDFIELVDMESPEAVTIRAYSNNGGPAPTPLIELNPAPLGDNSFQRVEVNTANVLRLEVEYIASGGLATLAYTPGGPTATTLLGVDASSRPTFLWMLALVLMPLVAVSAYVLRRPSAG